VHVHLTVRVRADPLTQSLTSSSSRCKLLVHDDVAVLVVDLGSSTRKAGFVGDDVPCGTFSFIVGRPCTSLPAWRSAWTGSMAERRSTAVTFTYPIECASVTNFALRPRSTLSCSSRNR